MKKLFLLVNVEVDNNQDDYSSTIENISCKPVTLGEAIEENLKDNKDHEVFEKLGSILEKANKNKKDQFSNSLIYTMEKHGFYHISKIEKVKIPILHDEVIITDKYDRMIDKNNISKLSSLSLEEIAKGIGSLYVKMSLGCLPEELNNKIKVIQEKNKQKLQKREEKKKLKELEEQKKKIEEAKKVLQEAGEL